MVRRRVVFSGMTLGDRVRDQRKARGWSQAELARRVSALAKRRVTQTAIYHTESRGNVSPRFVVELADALGVSLEWLREGRGNLPLTANKEQNEETVSQVFGNNRQPVANLDSSLRPLVVYRTLLSESAGRGGVMLYAEPVDEVPRPFFLKFSHKAFAIKVLNDDNHPVYKRWDTILVDPGGSMALGEDHMFSPDVTPEGVIAVIGCLKQITPSHWIVHNYGTKQDQELPRSGLNAWPIVGRYNRR
jgi:transcriptional regulator with XRE-family HTH domain